MFCAVDIFKISQLKSNKNTALNNVVVEAEGISVVIYSHFKQSLGSRLVVKTTNDKCYQLSAVAGYMLDMSSYSSVAHIIHTKTDSKYAFVEK